MKASGEFQYFLSQYCSRNRLCLSSSSFHRAAVSRKRSNADVDDSSAQSSETLLEEKTGLISWGYMSDNKLFEMEKVVNQVPFTPRGSPEMVPIQSNHVLMLLITD